MLGAMLVALLEAMLLLCIAIKYKPPRARTVQ